MASIFSSRPRRFGKSLFLSTLKELFEGSEPLFEGLAIRGNWDRSIKHPVVRLSFGSGHVDMPGGLHSNVMAQLADEEEVYGLSVANLTTSPDRLRKLIRSLRESTREQVVDWL